MIKLDLKQGLLLAYVIDKHGAQVRKGGQPYWYHPLEVAKITLEHEPNCIEVALCHDLFEDTNCTFEDLFIEMITIGYDNSYAYEVCNDVQALTDVYTRKACPNMNRHERKTSEADRLSKASYRAITVKFADLIHNTESIMVHEPSFAKTYLKEKEYFLTRVDGKGNKKLNKNANNSLKAAVFMMK